MRAGKLDRRVTIEQLAAGSPQQLGTGEPDESWVTVVTVWADVRFLRGRELLAAQQIAAAADHVIDLRYRAGITAKMRVSCGGVIYNIDAVNEAEKRRGLLQLYCSTGLNVG